MEKSLWEKRSNIWIPTFLTAIICGFVAHMYAMTNNFLTYDSMWNLYSNQDMLSSGRPFLTYACGISSYYNLPWLNGCLAIFYLALTSIVLVEIFGVKHKVTGTLIAALLVTFPSLTSTFCYIYTVDGYMLAILLASLAVFVTIRYKWGMILGAFLMCFSIGIYQAYFSFAIILCILYLLLWLLEENRWNVIFKKSGSMCIMGIVGYILYVIALKIMMSIKGTALSGYQGTNKVTSFDFSGVLKGIVTAYRDFKDFAMYGGILAPNTLVKLILVIMVLLSIALYVFLYLKKRSYKEIGRIALIVVLAAVIPLGTSTICILSPDTFFHILLRYPWVLLFMFPVVLAERFFEFKRTPGGQVKSLLVGRSVLALAICLSVLMSFNYAVAGNIVYYGMNERYEKTYAMCVRMVNRIESTADYKAGMKVAILGGIPSDLYYPSTDITTEVTKSYFGSQGTLCVSDTEKFKEFFAHYLGVTITTIPLEEEIGLTETEDFRNMGIFPENDSIQMIGDVLVIKLNG